MQEPRSKNQDFGWITMESNLLLLLFTSSLFFNRRMVFDITHRGGEVASILSADR
jgi:hypothetical protein